MFACGPRQSPCDDYSSSRGGTGRQFRVNDEMAEMRLQISGIRGAYEEIRQEMVALTVELQHRFQQQNEVIATLQAKIMHRSDTSRDALQFNLNQKISSEMYGSGVFQPVNSPLTPKVDAVISEQREQRKKEVQSQLVPLEGRMDKLTEEFAAHNLDVQAYMARIDLTTEILKTRLDSGIDEMRTCIEHVKSIRAQAPLLDESVPLGKPMQEHFEADVPMQLRGGRLDRSREGLQFIMNHEIASEMHDSVVVKPKVSPLTRKVDAPLTRKVDALISDQREQPEMVAQSQLVPLEQRVDRLIEEFAAHSADVQAYMDGIDLTAEDLKNRLDSGIEEMRTCIEDVKSIRAQKERLDESVPPRKPMQELRIGDTQDVFVVTECNNGATADVLETTLGDIDPEFEFAESLWDAALFMGGEAFGTAASLQIFFLLFINALVQLVYAYIISKSFTGSEFSDDAIADLERWRVNAAHAYRNIEENTFQSLATRVCMQDASLETSGKQFNKLSVINAYMPENAEDLFGNKRGQVMCTLAVLLWSLTVAKELKGLTLQNLAVTRHVYYNVLENHRLRLSQLKCVDGAWRMERFCIVRVSWSAFLSAFRIFIAIFLYVAGIQYLIHTINLRDLVLNAVALECVLLLDELMFEALAPWRVSSVMRNLTPLTMPRRCIWRGLDAVAISLLVAVSGCLVIIKPFLLDIEVGQLLTARDTMCAGRMDFVYASTNIAPFFAYAPSNDGSYAGLERDASIVRGIIAGSTEYANLNVGQLVGGAWSLDVQSSWSVMEGSSKMNNLCSDLLQEGPFQWEHEKRYSELYQKMVEQYLGGSPPITSCNAKTLKQSCDHDSMAGRLARILCARTCGCHLPDAKLIMTAPGGGCAVQCSTRPEYLEALANISCLDKSMTELQNDTLWKYQADQMVIIANAVYPPDAQVMAAILRTAMLSEGCGAVATLSAIGQDLCSESSIRAWPFRSLRRFCPVACKCSPGMLNCPGTCPRRI